jgi:hypothetical protein
MGSVHDPRQCDSLVVGRRPGFSQFTAGSYGSLNLGLSYSGYSVDSAGSGPDAVWMPQRSSVGNFKDRRHSLQPRR